MNKKIKNATPVNVGDIHFRSKMESKVYSLLKDNGLDFDYETNIRFNERVLSYN